jgi:hypoxanthine phosphoribosyltransferase
MQGIPCELISWDEVQRLIRDLASRLIGETFEPDLIVAVGRGGWVPARLLSDCLGNLNLTEVKVEHYRATKRLGVATIRYPLKADVTGQRVLLVDDVTDTGGSILAALDHIHRRGQPAELRTLVLHHKAASPYVPTYFACEVIEWRWIIYPWAVVEDLTALIRGLEAHQGDAAVLAEGLWHRHGIRVPAQTLKDVLRFVKPTEEAG